jgi:solute carrier family 25 2-oxodicarboxylate transporter 21
MGGSDTGGVFLAGAAAGICEGLIVQPMEMVKTRFQINKGQPMQIIPTMRAIVAEGGIRQLYRGGLPEIAGLVPRSSAMWSGYEFSRREMIKLNDGVCNTPIVAMAGVCGGVCEGTAFSPFQVVKVRLMAKEHLGVYKNTFDCVGKIVRNEGILALTIGLGPTLWRNCVWDSIYLSGMYNIDAHVPKPDSVVLRVIQDGLLGALQPW